MKMRLHQCNSSQPAKQSILSLIQLSLLQACYKLTVFIIFRNIPLIDNLDGYVLWRDRYCGLRVGNMTRILLHDMTNCVSQYLTMFYVYYNIFY